jgi:uncharacterized membrane protein YjjB (DUF3815 family)
MAEFLLHWVVPTISSCLACFGFTFILNIHGIGRLICTGGGSLVWFIYLLFDKSLMGAFCAAAAIGVYSEMMARLVRCPATGYLLVSLLPLVPGGGIYYTMSYCVQGERELFIQTLLTTFGMAATLAVGAMMASSLFRTLFPRFPHMPRIPRIRR